MNLAIFDEINNLKTRLRETYAEQSVSGDVDRRYYEDEIFDLLVLAWLMGVDDVNAELGSEIDPSVDDMEICIFRRIDDEDFRDRINKHLDNDDIEGVLLVADTEAMHAYNDGKFVTAEKLDDEAEATTEGGKASVMKTWVTMLDDRVRDTHAYLEGMSVPVGAEFYTYDGDHAPYPTGFELPENNCGCRCILEYSRA